MRAELGETGPAGFSERSGNLQRPPSLSEEFVRSYGSHGIVALACEHDERLPSLSDAASLMRLAPLVSGPSFLISGL